MFLYHPCEEHNNYIGDHYYCEEHEYLGTSSTCSDSYNINSNYWGGAVYGYTKKLDLSVTVYPVTMSFKDSTLKGYMQYASQVSGATNTLYNTSSKDIRYTIQSGNAQTQTGILKAGAQVSYKTAGSTAITVEPAKIAQTLTVTASHKSMYNKPQFNLGASVS